MKLLLKSPDQIITCSAGGKLFKRGPEMNDVGVMAGADVYIEDGTIKEIGKVTTDSDCDVFDVAGKILIPGLVDPHTHAVFAGTRENEFAMRARGISYSEIAKNGGGILETVRKTRETQKSKLRSHAAHRLDKMLKWGTTTIELKSGYGLDFKCEVKLLEAIQELKTESISDIVVTFLGAHAIPPECDHDTYIKTLTDEIIPYIAKRNLAEFCDVFCDEGFFSIQDSKEILTTAYENGLRLKMHADELSENGGVNLAVELGATSVDHLEHISPHEIKLLGKSDTIGVILPAVSAYLQSKSAPAKEMIGDDCAIAIASDFNPGTSMVDNMQTVMWLAVCFNKMTVEEALNAATINAAAAIGMSERLGSIEVGKQADILIVDTKDYAYLPYHFTENKITNVVKRGTILEFS